MQNKYLVIGALILVILLALGWYVFHKSTAIPTPSAGITQPTNNLDEHATYYDITVKYPVDTPLIESAGAAADIAARSSMLQFVRDTIATFKTEGNFDRLTPEDINTMGFDQGRKEMLQVTYTTASAPSTVSYIFTIYEDTLGAHGNTFFRTFTFDTKTGKQLTLADVFSSNAYLDTLSTISRVKLPSVIGEFSEADFIKTGTTPDATNFQNFYFEGTNFVLLFPPYQVAPYAAGPQTLRIPRSQLSSVLNAEYK